MYNIQNNDQTSPKRKPVLEFARDAFEKYLKMQERLTQFED